MQCKSWKKETAVLRQSILGTNELSLLSSTKVDPKWSGEWFHKKLRKRNQAPELEIGFERSSVNLDLSGCRLTLDRNILVRALPIESEPNHNFLSIDTNIVRLKFADALPLLFKQLIYQFALLPEHPSLLVTLAKKRLLSIAGSSPEVVDLVKDPITRGSSTRSTTNASLIDPAMLNEGFLTPSAVNPSAATNCEATTCLLG
ncbi:MAG: hypothetical protein WBD31_16770 [Rubripirellula sp.]